MREGLETRQRRQHQTDGENSTAVSVFSSILTGRGRIIADYVPLLENSRISHHVQDGVNPNPQTQQLGKYPSLFSPASYRYRMSIPVTQVEPSMVDDSGEVSTVCPTLREKATSPDHFNESASGDETPRRNMAPPLPLSPPAKVRLDANHCSTYAHKQPRKSLSHRLRHRLWTSKIPGRCRSGIISTTSTRTSYRGRSPIDEETMMRVFHRQVPCM